MEIDEIKKKVLEDVDPQLRSQKKKEMRKARLVISLQFLALAAVILLVFYLMMGFSTVTGNSMYPTLHDKDIVAYFRLGKEYKPGDVIVLERPDGEEICKKSRSSSRRYGKYPVRQGICEWRRSEIQRNARKDQTDWKQRRVSCGG